MKKLTLTLLFLCIFTASVFAQQEIPMFFDSELGLNTDNSVRVACSPDGNKITISSSGGKITIWDTATGREITRLSGHNTISSIVFSPNGKQLASCSSQDSAIKIWDTTSGKLIHSITQSGITNIAFSPDGSNIAGVIDKEIKTWNITNNSEARIFTDHNKQIMSLTYSPNGKQILTTSLDRTIKIWNTQNGKIFRTINIEENSNFRNVIYSPNSLNIAAYVVFPRNRTFAIKIYNVETGLELKSIQEAGSAMYSLDGKKILANARDENRNNVIKIFDSETGKELRSFNNSNQAVAFSPDGRKILTASTAFKIGDNNYSASYATLLDSTTGKTVGTIGYGPLNVGAKAYADMQIARFLNDTAAVTRNEAILQYITANGYATQKEIETFYRNNVGKLIGELVDKEFKGNKIPDRMPLIKQMLIKFFISPTQSIYTELLNEYHEYNEIFTDTIDIIDINESFLVMGKDNGWKDMIQNAQEAITQGKNTLKIAVSLWGEYNKFGNILYGLNADLAEKIQQ